jgi:hypothetical protein
MAARPSTRWFSTANAMYDKLKTFRYLSKVCAGDCIRRARPGEYPLSQMLNATSVTIVVPRCTPNAGELKRKYRNPHAYARLRDGWQHDIYYLMLPADRSWLQSLSANQTKMRVDIRVFHKNPYDKDNLYASVKPTLDSLTRLHFIFDDSEKYIELHVTQEYATANCTRIKLEPCD